MSVESKLTQATIVFKNELVKAISNKKKPLAKQIIFYASVSKMVDAICELVRKI
jgi:hypothetical protein